MARAVFQYFNLSRQIEEKRWISENEEREGIKRQKQRFVVVSQQPLEENRDFGLRDFRSDGGQIERERDRTWERERREREGGSSHRNKRPSKSSDRKFVNIWSFILSSFL